MSHRFVLEAFTSEVMVRIDKDGRLHAMNKPEEGWASYGQFLSWEDVAALDGWRIGSRGIDQHSQFFMLHKV